MFFREELVKKAFFDDAVRSVFQALPPLVAHHVLLVRKIRLAELIGKIAHAVGLQPQRQLQLIRRKCFEIIRAVKIRRSVDVRCAGRFQIAIVRAARHVFRTFKHHVLEKMREAGAARHFIRRANVIPQVDRNEWEPMILGQNDIEPVLQFIFFEFQLRHFKWRRLGRRLLGRSGFRGSLSGCFRGWLGSGFGRPLCRRSCWPLCLSCCEHGKGQNQQPKHENTPVEMPHHGVLSNGNNLAFSQRTALADVLGNPLLAYPASAPAQIVCARLAKAG